MQDRQESHQLEGGLGHHALTISIQNRSLSSCTVRGVPLIILLDENGHALSAPTCANCQNYLFSKQPVEEIRLAPKESAYLFIEYSINDGNGRLPCRETTAINIHLPGQGSSRRVDLDQVRSCGAIYTSPFLSKPLPDHDR
jgi:Protein of unknown function (DUF4232)